MTASKIFFLFCLSFIVGIGVSSFVQISQPLMLGFIILGLILISVFWSLPAPPPSAAGRGEGRKKLVVIGFCILFLVLGIWRHQLAELKIQKSELIKYNDQAQKVTLIGIVIKEPDIRETHTKLTIQPEEIYTENGSRCIEGRVLITTRRYPEYQYGDKLKITGQLETPEEFEDFNYKDYLAKDKIYSVIYFPEIEKIVSNQESQIYAKILNFKNKAREIIYQNLSPPQSSILGAVILGDKQRMSEDLKEKLNRTGLRHITAISGMHISIFTIILMEVLIWFGFWRKQAFYLTLIILFLFILMIGFPASAIRAGIFGAMFLLAQQVGRLKVYSRAIVFAAVLMLIVNPLLLKLDVGFQLSFLAVIGIAYLGPVFNKWFRRIPILTLRNILAMTLSAQVFTLPVLIYNFGRFSLVAPITNILIVPLLSYIMILGFIFVLLGAVWSFLAWLISWPVWLSLTYIVKINDLFSQLSFSYQTLQISWVWLIIAYIVLGFLTCHLYKKATLPDFIY